MGKALYDSFPSARRVYEDANDILGLDIADICFNGPEQELASTKNSQPAIFITSIAALRAFESHSSNKINPSACAGLSLGEYSALVACGALAFEDALRLVQFRGRFMEDASKANPGKMAAIIDLGPDVVGDIAEKSGSHIANLNCPGQVIVSGSHAAVDKTAELAKSMGAKYIMLNVSGPFHTSMMDKASDDLRHELDKARFSAPKIPFISNVTADYVNDIRSIKENLALQVNHRTMWEASVRRMTHDGISEFYEIGPGRVLKGLLRKIDKDIVVHNIEKPEDCA